MLPFATMASLARMRLAQLDAYAVWAALLLTIWLVMRLTDMLSTLRTPRRSTRPRSIPALLTLLALGAVALALWAPLPLARTGEAVLRLSLSRRRSAARVHLDHPREPIRLCLRGDPAHRGKSQSEFSLSIEDPRGHLLLAHRQAVAIDDAALAAVGPRFWRLAREGPGLQRGSDDRSGCAWSALLDAALPADLVVRAALAGQESGADFVLRARVASLTRGQLRATFGSIALMCTITALVLAFYGIGHPFGAALWWMFSLLAAAQMVLLAPVAAPLLIAWDLLVRWRIR